MPVGVDWPRGDVGKINERPSMRIWHQSFIVLEDVPAYTDRVRQHIDRVKHPGTVVDLHGPVPGTYSTEYPGVDLGYSFLFGMYSLQWPANAVVAQRECYDAKR